MRSVLQLLMQERNKSYLKKTCNYFITYQGKLNKYNFIYNFGDASINFADCITFLKLTDWAFELLQFQHKIFGPTAQLLF